MFTSKPSNNAPYVIAVVVMALIGVIAVVLIVLIRPDKDNSVLIATIGSFILPTTVALLAFMKSQETHVVVNSRMDEFRRQLEESSLLRQAAERQAGFIEGSRGGAASANARTDVLKEQEKEKEK